MTHLSHKVESLIPLSSNIDGINVISIYDCEIEREISRIPITDEAINLLSLSSDSKKIVYTADFKSITIIDIGNEEKQIIPFSINKAQISAILHTSDTENIIVIFPGLIFLVHLKTGKVNRKISTLYPIVTAAHIPGKSDEALFGYNDKCIEIKKLFGHIVRWRVQVPNAIYSIQASIDGQDQIISVYTKDEKLYIFNLNSVTPIYTKIINLQSYAILTNNRILLADRSGNLELWDIGSNSLVVKKNFVNNVTKIFPLSTKLFVILDDGTLFRLDPKTLDDLTFLKDIEYHHPVIINIKFYWGLPSPVKLPLENPLYPETIALYPIPDINLPHPTQIPSEIYTPCTFSPIEKGQLPFPVLLPLENPLYPETIALAPISEINLPHPTQIPSEIYIPCIFSPIEKGQLPFPVLLPLENPLYPETIALSPISEVHLPHPTQIPSEIYIPCTFSPTEKGQLPFPVLLPLEDPLYPETIALSPIPEVHLPSPIWISFDFKFQGIFSLHFPEITLPKPIKIIPSPIARARLEFDLLDGCIKINVSKSENLHVFYDSEEITENFVSVDCQSEYEIIFRAFNGENFCNINLKGITDEKPYLFFLLTDDFCPNKKEVPQQDFIIVTSKNNRLIPENEIQGGGDVVNWANYRWYILSFNNNSVYTLETPNNSYILWEPLNLIPFLTGGKRISNLPVIIDSQIYSEFPDLIIPGGCDNWSVQIFYSGNLAKISSHFSPWPDNIAYNYLSLSQDLTGKIGIFTIFVTSSKKQSHKFKLIVVPKLLIEFVLDGPFSIINDQQKTIQVRIQGPDHVLGSKKFGNFFEKNFVFYPEDTLTQVSLEFPIISVSYNHQLIDFTLVPPILYYSIGNKFHPLGIESQCRDLSKLISSEIDVYIPHYLKFNHFSVELSSDYSFSILQDLNQFSFDFCGNYIIRKYSLQVFRATLELFSPFSRLFFSIVGFSRGNKSRGNIISFSSWWLHALKVTENTIEWCEDNKNHHRTQLMLICDNNPDIDFPPIISNNGHCVVSHQGISDRYCLRFKSLEDGNTHFSLETEKLDEGDPVNNVYRMLRTFNPEDVYRSFSSQSHTNLISAQIQAIWLEDYKGSLYNLEKNNYDAKLLEAFCHWKLNLKHDISSKVLEFPNEREIKILYAADIVKQNKLQASMILTMAEPLIKLNNLNCIIELDARINLFNNGVGNINTLYPMAIRILSEFYFIKPLWDIIANLEKHMGNNGIRLSSFERIYSGDFIWFKEYQKSIRRIIEMI